MEQKLVKVPFDIELAKKITKKPEYRTGNYVCYARSYSTFLPYNDQTAHLIGTTKNWKE